MFEIVLVEPEIPHNAGAAGRLAVATGSRLHLIKPLGFSLDEKAVRRAGLDYWKHVDLVVWESWADYQAAHPETRQWFLSTKGTGHLWKTPFAQGDHLIFGAETRGLSPEIRASASPGQLLRIPMAAGPIRSLNLSTSIGIVLYEACRQVGEGLN
ncbi:tRNA (cytidine(34)-2'-O)-methyltransferase [Roseibacillus ishigakijimensis]|uniref:Putative tRNA (cytidine(34)-2'-O)-methyltransferase n=2 Tax=Roseibacillus ishigakijimensis TaxID=454146 RepID=A0A934VKT8_9BACT|nr:tRNA (cytidine(34)-2'-O)-methyltransferase [Roseibacillus ishigakijimensis]MBK1832517.1 tRNA (cytidine(34)-2'-O)-methyltransferase [Roseibacillus ishigakijimensis]